MDYGYTGKILQIDLGRSKIVETDIGATMKTKFLGGLGIASKILFDEVGPAVDPLSPYNIVIIAAGPLTGTVVPTSSRAEITTKSPLTGVVGTGNFGGFWGVRLKKAGYDAVVVRGRSCNPKYLWVDEDSVELRSADALWGRDSWETTDILKDELADDVSVMAIGPAGENLVRFACPIFDYAHAPGRSHAGCILGAKGLKAIAVRGTREIPVASPKKLRIIISAILTRLSSYPEKGDRQTVGSNYLTKATLEAGHLVVGNYQKTSLPKDSEIYELPESAEKHLEIGAEYGHNCPMGRSYGCDLVARVEACGPHGSRLEGVAFSLPGYEWGAKCGIKSYPDMWRCRMLCNRYGMDQVGPIPFAIELFEKGIITKRDTDGLELMYGEEQAIEEMLRKIAYREGIGDIFANGSIRAAKKIRKNAQKYVMTIKGMEILAGVDPRVASIPRLLSQMTCPRGGDDLKGTHATYVRFPTWAKKMGIDEETYIGWLLRRLDMPRAVKRRVFGVPPRLDRYTLDGGALLTKWYEELTCAYDSLGICMFAVNTWSVIGPTCCAQLYSACTGHSISSSELMKTGERIFNLLRAYSVREGLTRKDDALPTRFYEEPLADGPAKGAVLSRSKMIRLLDIYYDLRGWTRSTGIPTRRKLVELGLESVADELA
jgi:aldehyde:ferredoxin oxidoreductase